MTRHLRVVKSTSACIDFSALCIAKSASSWKIYDMCMKKLSPFFSASKKLFQASSILLSFVLVNSDDQVKNCNYIMRCKWRRQRHKKRTKKCRMWVCWRRLRTSAEQRSSITTWNSTFTRLAPCFSTFIIISFVYIQVLRAVRMST